MNFAALTAGSAVGREPHRLESNLEMIPKGTLDLRGRTIRQAGEGPGGASAEEQQKPWPLWWYALLGVALLGIAEIALSPAAM